MCADHRPGIRALMGPPSRPVLCCAPGADAATRRKAASVRPVEACPKTSDSGHALGIFVTLLVTPCLFSRVLKRIHADMPRVAL